MFTILDGVNRFLSFLNVNAQHKGRLYTVLGTFTTGYLGFLTWRFFRYQAYSRGFIYLALVGVLIYFLVLNACYYFTNYRPSWDVSRFFAKYVLEQEQHQVQDNAARVVDPAHYPQKFVMYDSLPTVENGQTVKEQVLLTPAGEEYLRQFISELEEGGTLPAATKRKKALTVAIPSTDLTELTESYQVVTGYNAMKRQAIGKLETVQGLPIRQVRTQYEVLPMRSFLRIDPITKQQPTVTFRVELEVFCRSK